MAKAKKRRKGHADRGSSMWTLVMTRARKQAERYAQAIPGEWPPFLVVVDVGHCIQLYADFTQSGKNYQPFPDPTSFQIWLADLAQPEIRERLQAVWLDPFSLDPSRISAKVTRQLAERLWNQRNHANSILAKQLTSLNHLLLRHLTSHRNPRLRRQVRDVLSETKHLRPECRYWKSSSVPTVAVE